METVAHNPLATIVIDNGSPSENLKLINKEMFNELLGNMASIILPIELAEIFNLVLRFGCTYEEMVDRLDLFDMSNHITWLIKKGLMEKSI